MSAPQLRLLYLHGLLAQPKSEKLDWLAAQPEVALTAPQIHYRLPGWFTQLQALWRRLEPQAVIGSSMGGYAAWHLARLSTNRVPLLLFNPVLRESDIRLPALSGGQNYDGPAVVVLGKRDPIVNPHITQEFLQQHAPQSRLLWVPDLEHRIPLDTFQQVVTPWLQERV